MTKDEEELLLITTKKENKETKYRLNNQILKTN